MSTERGRGGRKQRMWMAAMSRRADFLKEERHQQEAEEEYEPCEPAAETSSVRGSGSAEHSRGSGGNWNNKANVGPPPAHDGSKEAGAWEEYRIRAKLWLRTTNLDGKSQGPRMLQMLKGNAFDMLKVFAEDDEWCEDPNGGWRLLEIMSGEEYYGKEEYESLWSAMDKLLYKKMKHDGDGFNAFKSRFEEAVRKLERHKIKLPDEALGFIYLKQVKIDEDTLKDVITMNNGDLRLREVQSALRKLNIEMIDSGSKSTKSTWLGELEGNLRDDYQGTSSTRTPGGSDHGEDDEYDAEILEDALYELDAEVPEEITEDEAKEVLMTLIKNKYNPPVQGMRYNQVQRTKQNFKLSRGFNNAGRGSGKSFGKGVGKKDVTYLKSITKCKGCGQKGHWHKDAVCPKRLGGDGGEIVTKNQFMALAEELPGDYSKSDDIAAAMEKLGSALNSIRE